MNISKFVDKLFSRAALRGIVAIGLFIVLWEVGARSEQWFGYRFPFIGLVPPPSDVFVSWGELIRDPSYWESWYMSFGRVLGGFLAAMIVGIPSGY